MFVAVETSDIVGSTSLSPELQGQALEELKQCLKNIASEDIGKFEISRGDAYQVLYFNAQDALRQALLTKLFMMFRVSQTILISQSIAVGELLPPLKQIGEHMEQVFVDSGRQLETLPSAYLGFHANGFSSDFLLALSFMNRLLSQLTNKQAEILYWAIRLNFPEQKIIAKQLNMSRQNVNIHLQRANADLFRAILDRYASNIKELIK